MFSVEKEATISTSFVTVLQYPTGHICLTRHGTDGLAHPTVGPQIKRIGPRPYCSQSSATMGETLPNSRRIMTSILHAPPRSAILLECAPVPRTLKAQALSPTYGMARAYGRMSICRSGHWGRTGVSEILGARMSTTRYAFEQVCAPAPALGAIVSLRTPVVFENGKGGLCSRYYLAPPQVPSVLRAGVELLAFNHLLGGLEIAGSARPRPSVFALAAMNCCWSVAPCASRQRLQPAFGNEV